MAKEWINHYVDLEGQWVRGEREFLKSSKTVGFGGGSVRIHETACGGDVLLSPLRRSLIGYGGAEVYLKIYFTNGKWEYLSAPLATPIDLDNVESIELNLLFLVGNVAADRINYRALVNGHCVYERLSVGVAVDSDLISGVTGTAMQGQSYNETRALDVTVLSPRNLAVERMVLNGYRFVTAGNAVVGARIYDSATNALVSTSQDINLTGSSIGVPLSVPVAATLISGRSYRIGFYALGNPQASSSGDLFQPSSLPYAESSGLFRINSIHSGAADGFPQGPNLFAPRVAIRTHPT